jgi:hypothetical protein
MPTYVIVNRVPEGYRPSPEAQRAWTVWFEGLDASLVDRGNPVFSSTTLGASGVETALGGYTLVSADDLEVAVALAKSCPALSYGGGVEVGELTLLNRGTERIGE